MIDMDCCNNNNNKIKVRTEEEKKEIITRINRITGQMNGIKEMISNDRYCDDVLIQLSAVDKSIKSLANLILDKHMHSCLIENIKNGNLEVIDEIVDLFKRFQ
jgi:DNA-binding FrmR family transcriptional regulator